MSYITLNNPPHLTIQQVAGGDEAGLGVDIVVAGMLATDGLYGVLMCSAAYVAEQWRPITDFETGAGVLTVIAHPVDTTGHFYLIFWKDVT